MLGDRLHRCLLLADGICETAVPEATTRRPPLLSAAVIAARRWPTGTDAPVVTRGRIMLAVLSASGRLPGNVARMNGHRAPFSQIVTPHLLADRLRIRLQACAVISAMTGDLHGAATASSPSAAVSLSPAGQMTMRTGGYRRPHDEPSASGCFDTRCDRGFAAPETAIAFSYAFHERDGSSRLASSSATAKRLWQCLHDLGICDVAMYRDRPRVCLDRAGDSAIVVTGIPCIATCRRMPAPPSEGVAGPAARGYCRQRPGDCGACCCDGRQRDCFGGATSGFNSP